MHVPDCRCEFSRTISHQFTHGFLVTLVYSLSQTKLSTVGMIKVTVHFQHWSQKPQSCSLRPQIFRLAPRIGISEQNRKMTQDLSQQMLVLSLRMHALNQTGTRIFPFTFLISTTTYGIWSSLAVYQNTDHWPPKTSSYHCLAGYTMWECHSPQVRLECKLYTLPWHFLVSWLLLQKLYIHPILSVLTLPLLEKD